MSTLSLNTLNFRLYTFTGKKDPDVQSRPCFLFTEQSVVVALLLDDVVKDHIEILVVNSALCLRL